MARGSVSFGVSQRVQVPSREEQRGETKLKLFTYGVGTERGIRKRQSRWRPRAENQDNIAAQKPGRSISRSFQ